MARCFTTHIEVLYKWTLSEWNLMQHSALSYNHYLWEPSYQRSPLSPFQRSLYFQSPANIILDIHPTTTLLRKWTFLGPRSLFSLFSSWRPPAKGLLRIAWYQISWSLLDRPLIAHASITRKIRSTEKPVPPLVSFYMPIKRIMENQAGRAAIPKMFNRWLTMTKMKISKRVRVVLQHQVVKTLWGMQLESRLETRCTKMARALTKVRREFR